MEKLKILILLHQRDTRFDSGGYLIQFLMREWKEMGCTIQVMRGTRHQVQADLMIPHLDLTTTPHEYRNFLLAYPNVINKHVVDISKSRISRHLVARDDSCIGPVIVKTDRNYGGIPEQQFFSLSRWEKWVRRGRRLLAKLRGRNIRDGSWRYVEHIPPGDYPVFPTVHDVPEEVFQNKNLVVEKFFSEIADGDYCLRVYYFFGSAGFNLLLHSKERAIRGKTALKVEEVPIPEELCEIKEELGFDYGKFDYVLHEGKVVLFDANRTPGTDTLQHWGLLEQAARRLAGGIKEKLAEQNREIEGA